MADLTVTVTRVQRSPTSEIAIREHRVLVDRPTGKGGQDRGPMGGELLRDQIRSRDPDLLLVGVSGQHQDLHPVTQGPGDGVECVGSGDEQHLRQVEGHREVVVHEGVILGWIQYLQ